jgi:Na+-driven multidrug efflux pump
MIAHLGEYYLAASVIISTLWMALSFSFCGALSSIGVLISHAYGANKPETEAIQK